MTRAVTSTRNKMENLKLKFHIPRNAQEHFLILSDRVITYQMQVINEGNYIIDTEDYKQFLKSYEFISHFMIKLKDADNDFLRASMYGLYASCTFLKMIIDDRGIEVIECN